MFLLRALFYVFLVVIAFWTLFVVSELLDPGRWLTGLSDRRKGKRHSFRRFTADKGVASPNHLSSRIISDECEHVDA